MTRRRRRRPTGGAAARWGAAAAAAAAALVAGAAGCDEPRLASRSRVVTPRILGIIAEPPELAPGQIGMLRVITGGTTEAPAFRWYACTRPEATTTFIASSTFGQAEPNSGCFPDGGAEVFPLGQGERVFYGVPGDLLARLEALAAIYGRSLSAESLRRIARTSGVTLTMAVEMTHGQALERGIKRVIIADRAAPNRNPPPPAFTLLVGGADAGGQRVRMARSLDDPDDCAPFPDQPVRVRRGQRVEIAPEPDEARWLQEYDSLDSSGNITRLRETAFYSWYSTDGWFTSDRTRIPTRNTIWTAPHQDGEVTLWVFVRDGRGGTSFCRWRIAVAGAAM